MVIELSTGELKYLHKNYYNEEVEDMEEDCMIDNTIIEEDYLLNNNTTGEA